MVNEAHRVEVKIGLPLPAPVVLTLLRACSDVWPSTTAAVGAEGMSIFLPTSAELPGDGHDDGADRTIALLDHLIEGVLAVERGRIEQNGTMPEGGAAGFDRAVATLRDYRRVIYGPTGKAAQAGVGNG